MKPRAKGPHARPLKPATAIAFAIGLFGMPARADNSCFEAADAGQSLRDAGKLVEAREQFLSCARATCPAVVQKDCAGWLADVERNLPTVVFAAKNASGADLFDVRVKRDGVVVAASLDGRPVSVDPGPHTFTFEATGRDPIEEKLLVRAGEKNRQLTVTFQDQSKIIATPSERAVPIANTTPSGGLGGQKIAAIVVGATGLVAIGVGSYFGLLADSQRNDAVTTCGAGCPPGSAPQDELARAHTSADVSTGLFIGGAVAIVVGVVVWLAAPRGHVTKAIGPLGLLARF